jgi:hypothetical protein
MTKSAARGRGKSNAKTGAKRGAGTGRTSQAKRGAARPRTAPRKPGRAAVGKSGVMPEIGAARVEATPALGTRPTATRKPSGRAAAQLPGEKAVARTNQTFPGEAERTTPGEQEAMPPAAVDRRRQIVGTDDPGTKPRR